MKRRIRWIAWTAGIVVLACGYWAFEALSEKKDEFQLALPGYEFRFPRDHFAHPEYRLEWWYYTGHLTERPRARRTFGFQLTFFRMGLSREERRQSKWASQTVYFAHFAITNVGDGTFFYKERVGRGALGTSGARTDLYRVWIDDWRAQGLGRYHHLQAAQDSVELQLVLLPSKTPTIHGIDGVSQKSEERGKATHYYSLSRLAAEGLLMLGGEAIEVEGQAWMDREFGSNRLDDDQEGWDWFGIQLDNDEELMLYQLRLKDGTIEPASSGTWIGKGGRTEHLHRGDFAIEVLDTWSSPRSGARYPSRWKVRVPERRFEAVVRPLAADQELITEESTRVTYWEGAVQVEAKVDGRDVGGRGYVELTGYAKPLKI